MMVGIENINDTTLFLPTSFAKMELRNRRLNPVQLIVRIERCIVPASVKEKYEETGNQTDMARKNRYKLREQKRLWKQNNKDKVKEQKRRYRERIVDGPLGEHQLILLLFAPSVNGVLFGVVLNVQDLLAFVS